MVLKGRIHMYATGGHKQDQAEPDGDAAALSPEERVEGRAAAPAPGVERPEDNEVKHETSPNTE